METDKDTADALRPLVLDWIGGIEIGHCAHGWFARIDGTDVFDDINRYGCKTRRSLSIAEGIKSREAVERRAREWLTRQLSGVLAAPSVVGETKPDRKIYDELTDAVIGVLQHFDYIDRKGPPQTAAEAIAPTSDGLNRYRCDPIFRAKVRTLVHRVAEVVTG